MRRYALSTAFESTPHELFANAINRMEVSGAIVGLVDIAMRVMPAIHFGLGSAQRLFNVVKGLVQSGQLAFQVTPQIALAVRERSNFSERAITGFADVRNNCLEAGRTQVWVVELILQVHRLACQAADCE